MQVPEHVVSFYVATCGQNGPGLGSDEKEIILLVYVILEATTGQIIGTKQILVRPEGTFIKDRTTSTSSDASNNASSPPLAITYADSVNNSSCSSSNLNSTNNSINSLNITNNSSTPTSPTSTNANFSNNNITTTISLTATNINNNNTIVNNNNIANGPTTLGSVETIELPIAVAQAAGKPLQEAIKEFDEYLRSLSLHETEFKIITDGQLPLRQCLHREACVKEIGLPSYYNKFADLRKEFSMFKSGDLSRALVPVKDIKRILQMPATTLPQSIGEIMKELNITSVDDNEFYVRESRDMVSVIQHLLKAGHKFNANETVSLVLEPGICSIDDEIDGNCIVRARGLPWQSSDQDIAKFFRGLNVAKYKGTNYKLIIIELCGEKPPIEQWHYISTGQTARISFTTSDKTVGAQGFRIVWTEIQDSGPGPPTIGLLCESTYHFQCEVGYCISDKLLCDGVKNCGPNDDSDELHCES